MSYNKNVVEDALFQIRNLEETLQENAKGILQSTMSEEIKQLVKESLKEQEEVDTLPTDDEEMDMDADMEMDDEEMDMDADMEMDDEEMDMDADMEMDDEEMDMDADMEMDDEEMDMDADMEMDDEDAIDMTDASDEEVLKVFRAMGDEDGIVVKKDGDFIHLTDEDDDYLIQLGESYEEDFEEDDYDYSTNLGEMEDEEDFEMDYYLTDLPEGDHMMSNFSMDEEEEEDEYYEGTIYEIEMDDEEDFEMDDYPTDLPEEDDDMMSNFPMDEEEDESEYDLDAVMEAVKKSIKPKGVGIGHGPKFKYNNKPNQNLPVKKQKEAFGKGIKAVGTGRAKFEYKEGENMEKGSMKKVETKEASRTYGNGSKNNSRGLRKGRMNNRNYEYNPFKISENRVNQDVELLREKNEEYKKALDVFRIKLNEVAVFNSNLAYATRLFTEHSTTKQEKINILRRFDDVETIKESKNLYRAIKNELSSNGSVGEQKINESIERTVNKTVETGSAVNLIESKTYENPQFLRMKDLMTKLK